MKNHIKQLALFISFAICFSFVIFVINQTAQVVQLAATVNPVFGQVVLYTLIAIYTVIILVPVVLFLKLPKAIRISEEWKSLDFETYHKQLKSRLASNPYLKDKHVNLNDQLGMEEAVKILDARANDMIKETASAVFVSTAVSQNGRLDAFMVLIAQSRMVWQIAHVYHQRPSLRELVYLYANVAGTTFLVSEIEDLDIAEQVEPIIVSALGGTAASVVPGVSVVANLVVNSLTEGSANAFLTLRVGIVTRKYCGLMTKLDKKAIRRMATTEAASMLGGILAKSGGVVTNAIWSAGKKAGVGVAKAVGTGAVQASREVLDVAKKAGSTAVETTGHIAGQSWDITKSVAEKINPFKKKLDVQDDNISENIDHVTPGTNAGDL